MFHVVLNHPARADQPDDQPGDQPDDQGFTLVELVMAIAILGMIMTAVATMLMTSLMANRQSDRRLGESTDFQFATSYFADDAQGAVTVDVGGTPDCASTAAGADPTDVVEFRGNSFDDTGNTRLTRIAYVLRTVVEASGSTRELRRVACSGPDVSHLTHDAETTVARHLSGVTAPSIACRSVAAQVACSAAAMTSVQVTVTEASGFSYSLLGTRRTT
jgi:prepilin-type N-terminal cleavage/methylation domain-containing protein